MPNNGQPHANEHATTRNPPNVTAQTHILGLCGATDIRNTAAPNRDGWIVSDFFLWKGILRRMGKTQHWYACVEPTILVNKYESQYPTGPYIQGSPYEDDRAVVLSRGQLCQATEDLTAVPDDGSMGLRDLFMAAFKSKCRQAATDGDPVLLIVTAHGSEENEGAFIIGLPDGVYSGSDVLTPRMLGDAVRDIPNLRLSTFLTSCYSEFWVLTPHFSPLSPAVMATAEKDEESLSWPHSTMARFGGGVFSSIALQEILRESGVMHANQSLISGENLPPVDSQEGRSFREWCDAVEAEMIRFQIRGRGYGSKPCFTRAGGHDRFWVRSGYPVQEDYVANWNALPKLPKSQHANPTFDRRRLLEDITDEEVESYETFMAQTPWQLSSIPAQAARTGSMGSSRLRLRLKAKDLAVKYLKSQPGLAEANENRRVFADCHNLVHSNSLSDEEVVELEAILSYRFHKMMSAEFLLRAMRCISMPGIASWIWEDWSSQNLYQPSSSQNKTTFESNLDKVRRWPLCRKPAAKEWGREWLKPERYLAAAFTMCNKDPDVEIASLQKQTLEKARETARLRLSGSKRLRTVCRGAQSWSISKAGGSPSMKRRSVLDYFESADAGK